MLYSGYCAMCIIKRKDIILRIGFESRKHSLSFKPKFKVKGEKLHNIWGSWKTKEQSNKSPCYK